MFQSTLTSAQNCPSRGWITYLKIPAAGRPNSVSGLFRATISRGIPPNSCPFISSHQIMAGALTAFWKENPLRLVSLPIILCSALQVTYSSETDSSSKNGSGVTLCLVFRSGPRSNQIACLKTISSRTPEHHLLP